jgi:four helix bundle protein
MSHASNAMAIGLFEMKKGTGHEALGMSDGIKSHRDLIAWQRAFDLGLLTYELTTKFPEHERFNLTVMIRRTAIQIASHIADGYGRQSTTDYIRLLRSARGGLYELDTQLLYAVRSNYLNEETYERANSKLEECSRILAGLIRSLER